MTVRMELSRILIRELADVQIIELREAEPKAGIAPRTFPIVIGLTEAQAIERRLKGVIIKRPQTHDLLANVIAQLGGKVTAIHVTHLQEHTFFASILIQTSDGNEVTIDSRPSDAIAIGIAEKAPIYVAEEVIEAAGRDET